MLNHACWRDRLLGLLVAMPGVASAANADLESRAPLDTILGLVFLEGPDVRGPVRHIEAARIRSEAQDNLPSPELRVESWAVPIARPYDFAAAQMLMVGLTQTFPAPGLLQHRQEAAQHDVAALEASWAWRRIEMAASVKTAYVDFARTHEEIALLGEHIQAAERIAHLIETHYAAGMGTMKDAITPAIEIARLRAQLVAASAKKVQAVARLNAFMGRAPDALLGTPDALDLPSEPGQWQTWVDRMNQEHPELRAAAHAHRAQTARREAAQTEAVWPDFMAGISYMVMPEDHEPHRYGLMLGMTLPWLWGRTREDVEGARAQEDGRRWDEAGAHNAARSQVFIEWQRETAARKRYDVLRNEVVPPVDRVLRVLMESFEAGRGGGIEIFEALRSSLAARREVLDAKAEVLWRRTELEKAAGRPIDITEKEGSP